MKDKTKRILAIIALVFIGVFTVSFVVFLVTRGNVEAFVTLFSGVAGVCLFLIIKMFEKKEKENVIEGIGDGADSDEDTKAEETEAEEPEAEETEAKDGESEKETDDTEQ